MTVNRLGAASEIQYQGTQDLASNLLLSPLNVALFVGRFRRGSNKPMEINKDNIIARLGKDIDNPDFRAVVEVLNAGVSSVMVMNLGSGVAPT